MLNEFWWCSFTVYSDKALHITHMIDKVRAGAQRGSLTFLENIGSKSSI